MIVLVSKFDIYVFITITAVGLLVPEGIIRPLLRHWQDLLNIFFIEIYNS
jgi:hypothetical protein